VACIFEHPERFPSSKTVY